MTSVRRRKGPVAEHKSPTVAKSIDPRVQKTRARIAHAFVELIARRPYFRIRVSDIARKAGIGRATFYAHFASKEALLRDQFERIVLPMVVELPGDACLVDCTRLFAHVRHTPHIYRSLSAGPGGAVTDRIVQDALEMRVAGLVAERIARDGKPVPSPGFVPRFVAGTVMTLIAWSLEQQPPPTAAGMQSAYRSLVGRALDGGRTTAGRKPAGMR